MITRMPLKFKTKDIQEIMAVYNNPKISITNICVQFGINRSYLNKVAKNYFNEERYEYLRRCRKEYANQLVSEKVTEYWKQKKLGK